ncbi:MAG: hypothetical protein ABR570_08535, partial [Burkholderiales bacterium]
MAPPAKQRGVALLLLALVFIVGFAAVLYQRRGAWADATTAGRNMNARVLEQAKAALLGYVVKEVLDLSNDFPGRFPCPESPGVAGTSSEGIAVGSCSPTFPTAKTIGRLPWRTLGLDKLFDASAEPLWYAVSQNWVFDNSSPPVITINDGTSG